MRSLVILFAAFSLGWAKPQLHGLHVLPVKSVGTYVINGQDANPGEFPWQLSMTRNGGHSCGSSLLDGGRSLTAAHCVDGAPVASLAVIAGLHNRNDLAGTQAGAVSSYAMHGEYNSGDAAYANDVAIMHHSNIVIGGNIQAATLPANNGNSYAGTTCVISGWGRTDASNNLPNTLQKLSIPVISTGDCTNAMVGVGGAEIWDNHICVQDPAGNSGACNGDSGGPLNCPDGVTRVVGITSWVVANGAGECLTGYPSVYTRVGPYLDWIGSN